MGLEAKENNGKGEEQEEEDDKEEGMGLDGGVSSDGRRGKVEEEEEKVEWKLGCIEEVGGWSEMGGEMTWRRMKRRWFRRRK